MDNAGFAAVLVSCFLSCNLRVLCTYGLGEFQHTKRVCVSLTAKPEIWIADQFCQFIKNKLLCLDNWQSRVKNLAYF